MAALIDIVRYMDEYLHVATCGDWSNALNGLQVENSGTVSKIGAAVDASTRTFTAAAEGGADLLIVHHGLFWPGLQPITGAFRRQLGLLFEKDMALYSAHLPLDLHPSVGNNAQLAAALGIQKTEPFFETKGQFIGIKAGVTVARDELHARLEHSLGHPAQMFAFGPAETRNIGIVTGGAGGEVYAAARDGIDTFISGEATHSGAVAAEELGINLLLGGHYATETFGVKALAAHISQRFELPWEFIVAPTGL
ncbi:MAG: Nif3-like dinuclear metal center hexameric protein [Chthoniobacterales bacterium]|nr:Nif3-like dinuclear metal center hexameric protein [Chthoniobacterales bacterium]